MRISRRSLRSSLLAATLMAQFSSGLISSGITTSSTPQSSSFWQKYHFPDPDEPEISPFVEWKEYDGLRSSDLDKEILDDFFSKRPRVVAQRLVKVSTTLYQTRQRWRQSEREKVDLKHAEEENFFASQDAQAQKLVDTKIVVETEERATDLCSSLSSLGPVAVKIGQTLSQRPDIVGHDAAQALLRLQTRNLPYPNEWAHEVLRSELNCQEIPLAPDIIDEGLTKPSAKPLFAKLTVHPVACASLGQVYKGTLWDGREVAVKVQRPDALSILAKDIQCFRNVFQTRRRIQKWLEGNNDNSDIAENKQDIGSIIDRVGKDVLKELDYTLEAANSAEFRESLSFLGFVTTPEPVPEYSTQRVLVTEWVQGAHLSDLSVEEGLAMTRMAVEACTASMVLTGFIHADPHEGNLMLHEDGRVVFLDFGLMSRVDQTIMEGFARGIQSLLSEDWRTLTESFIDIGFVSEPIMHRSGLNDTWKVDSNYDIDELAEELAEAMENTVGGKARFGSLATVLNKKISPTWLVYTPPYVLLLVRTFLTLEGIAAKLDPSFNIYEMAMPWAVRRSLSPSTQRGIDVFRSTIMTPDNRIQWLRFLELAKQSGDDDNKNGAGTSDRVDIEKKAKQDAAKNAAMQAAVGSLLGAPEGRALRRALKDIDSTDLIQKLGTKDGRLLLHKTMSTNKAKPQSNDGAVDRTAIRPVSEECQKLRQREARWRKKVNKLLLWTHIRKQMGLKGLLSIAKFSTVFVRVAASVLFARLRNLFTRGRRPALLAEETV